MEMHFSKTHSEFEQYIITCIQEKEFVRIQFYNDINAFFSEQTLLKNWNDTTKELTLQNDEIVPLSKIVRINETAAVGYDQAYFKCDC